MNDARSQPVAPTREEAEELVHQLASLGGTPAAPTPASATRDEAAADDEEGGQSTSPQGASEDEPINRGMLLKFLSSVRP